MTDDLVERVARAIADEDGAEWGSISDLARSMYRREAERAIRIALEEAAKVADDCPDSYWGQSIAAAIREMVKDGA
jgi:hypothetical protein